MTTPRVETTTIGGTRWYIDPLTGERVPGVSAIKDMLHKPALLGAAVRETADFVTQNLDSIVPLVASDENAARMLIKGAYRRAWDKKADSGTGVHGIVEQLLKRQLDPSVPGPRVTPTQRQYLSGYAKWYGTFGVQPQYVEQTVWSAKHDYAGTADFIGTVHLSPEHQDLLDLPEEITAVVDMKTGASGVWPETCLQQVAYKKADYMLMDDGTRLAMPSIDATFALWLRPEGYAFIPLDSSDMTWRTFLGLRQAFDWEKRSRSMVGKPLNANPIKRQRRK